MYTAPFAPYEIGHRKPEYALADEIYNFLDIVEMVARRNKRKFWIVGGLPGGIVMRNAPSE